MTTTQLKGNPVSLAGQFPNKKMTAKHFKAVLQDLSEFSLADLKGQRVVLNIFPSIDTDVCATSVRKFNQEAAGLENTRVVCLSFDLPFAQKRFCGAEGIENVTTASLFRNPEFGTDYGVLIQDGPLAGLAARAVVVVDVEGQIIHCELVDDISHEPDYGAVFASLAQ